MNFLGELSQKLGHYRQTDAQTDMTENRCYRAAFVGGN